MVNVKTVRQWDQEHEDVRIKLAGTRLALKRATAVVREKQMEHDRAERLQIRAEKKAKDAVAGEGFARRKLEEAQRGGVDARRKELPRHRWTAEIRRWNAQLEIAEGDVRRWGDDTRRQETLVKNLNQEIEDQREEVERLTAEIKVLDERFRYLVKFGQGLKTRNRNLLKSSAEQAARQVSPSFAITRRATAALKEVLNGLEREPNQLLRLSVSPEGGISLTLDTAQPGYTVVSHEGAPGPARVPRAAHQPGWKDSGHQPIVRGDTDHSQLSPARTLSNGPLTPLEAAATLAALACTVLYPHP